MLKCIFSSQFHTGYDAKRDVIYAVVPHMLAVQQPYDQAQLLLLQWFRLGHPIVQ